MVAIEKHARKHDDKQLHGESLEPHHHPAVLQKRMRHSFLVTRAEERRYTSNFCHESHESLIFFQKSYEAPKRVA